MFAFSEAIVQNEIWPFGVQTRNQGVAFKNKKQLGIGFIDTTQTYVRVVCFGVFITIVFWLFRFRESDTCLHSETVMQISSGFIGNKKTSIRYLIPKEASRNSKENREARALTKTLVFIMFFKYGKRQH